MTQKPPNFEWAGFTKEQIGVLDSLDFYGNNGWARNGQSEALLPILLGECAAAGLDLPRIRDALSAIGYQPRELRQLERWESKRTTGKFGR
jgi:hypothetical protein